MHERPALLNDDWYPSHASRASHEVSMEERRYQNGSDPQLLDIVAVPGVGHQPLPHQVENHVLDAGFFWTRLPTRYHRYAHSVTRYTPNPNPSAKPGR